MERVRIAILDAYDNVLAFMDNGAPKALHYCEDELHEYLKGTANTLTFCSGAKHEDAQYLVEGNKLSFLYRDKEYYLNIMNVRKDELEVEVTAYSLSFELLNEEKEKYAATEAKTFAQYLEIFDAEHIITLGNNEVSDKSIKHEWEGSSTLLARLFSLATVFSAEVEFIPQLNDNYSLKAIVMNVYKEHTDEIQGIGVNRNDIVLRYGKNVTGIVKTSDITGLYTAIRPFGRDGLTITDLDKSEYDADGNLEYYTESGSNNILAPQARDRFPSNLWSAKDRYIAKIYEYDTDNVNVLYGNALAELKKNCVPQVEYEVSGYFDTDIGDTVQIEDDEYNPALYLEARVTEQVRSFTDLNRNKTTFDNFHELQSQLDSDLVAKMNALIEQNKTYTCMISTDNGTTFKNNTGSTTLTASVRDGVTDVTDKFEIVWSKDGADLANGKSITVNAADVDGKALYRFDAKDSAGNVKGFYEVTVTDVDDGTDGVSPTVEVNEDTSLTITDSEGTKNTGPLKGEDGKTYYTHIKYSDDGETFTGKGNLASRKREDWVKGYYSSNTTIDTEAPDEMTASSNYKRICMKQLIPVVPGETYQITSGHAFIGMGITKYGADGNSVGIDTVDGSLSIQQYKVPDDTYHVRLYMSGSSPYVTKYGSWSELFEKNSVSPMFGEPESKLGSYPGAWMGQMVSDDPTPSTVFEDYTWKKIEGDPTGIVESADEPSDKYVGMLWKNTGTTSGLVQGATYRWNGTEWEMYKFSATNIEAETFRGYLFSGAIYESEFNDDVSPYLRYNGKMHIESGVMTIDTTKYTRATQEGEWQAGVAQNIALSYEGIKMSESKQGSETSEELILSFDNLKKLLADTIVVPEKLPNPYPLTFTGGASGIYDGSEALTINIPSGGVGSTYYVTPEQFGAIGDGVTDDSEAFRQAIETEKPIVCTYGKKYNCITEIATEKTTINIIGNRCMLKNFHLKINVNSGETSWINAYPVPNSTIQDVNFNGTDKPEYCIKTGIPIKFLNCKWDFYDIMVKNYGSYMDYIVFENCAFKNHSGTHYAIDLAYLGDQHVFRECDFGGTGENRKFVSLSGCQSATIINCLFAGDHIIYSSNVVFIGCHMEGVSSITVGGDKTWDTILHFIDCYFWDMYTLSLAKSSSFFDSCTFYISHQCIVGGRDYASYNQKNCKILCATTSEPNSYVNLDDLVNRKEFPERKALSNSCVYQSSAGAVAQGRNWPLNTGSYTYLFFPSTNPYSIDGWNFYYTKATLTFEISSDSSIVSFTGNSDFAGYYLWCYRTSPDGTIHRAIMPMHMDRFYDYGQYMNGIPWVEVDATPDPKTSLATFKNGIYYSGDGSCNGKNCMCINTSNGIISYISEDGVVHKNEYVDASEVMY